VVAPCGGEGALHAGIGMTINLPGHFMSVAQCYLVMNGTNAIPVSTHLHHFQVIECDVYF